MRCQMSYLVFYLINIQSFVCLYLQLCYHIGPEIEPDERDRQTDREDIDILQRYVARCFPGLVPVPAVVESCMYTVSCASLNQQHSPSLLPPFAFSSLLPLRHSLSPCLFHPLSFSCFDILLRYVHLLNSELLFNVLVVSVHTKCLFTF